MQTLRAEALHRFVYIMCVCVCVCVCVGTWEMANLAWTATKIRHAGDHYHPIRLTLKARSNKRRKKIGFYQLSHLETDSPPSTVLLKQTMWLASKMIVIMQSFDHNKKERTALCSLWE